MFIAFNQMIEEQINIDTWERLLDEVNPASGGIYVSVEDFPDEELFALVEKLSELSGQSVPVLVESFGCYLFKFLTEKYPVFTDNEDNFFDFLKSIDSVIHKEVQKLYENPNLPKLDHEQISDNTLMMYYTSPRKLCLLAEGLIRGAALHYGVDYQLQHETCMHKGDKFCTFRITI